MKIYELRRLPEEGMLWKIESGNLPVFLGEDLFAIAMKRINYKEEPM